MNKLDRDAMLLKDWIALYDTVNSARWGEDHLPPPTWEEVRDTHLADWTITNMSFEYWEAYMVSMIISHARDVVKDWSISDDSP